MSAMRPGQRLSTPIPARAGVGFKHEHFADIIVGDPDIGWFEVHPENYMGGGGRPHYMLERVRERYPLSMHGVGLSIGGAGRLDPSHLGRLSAFVARYEPGLVSEHLAWSTHEGYFLNDLLPLPYTEATLAHVVRHVDELQCCLGRRVLIENPSTYVSFGVSDMTEVAFLSELVRRSGCGLLLDVNNVHVSATNHDFDATAYVDAFPIEHVGEVHLAGYAEFEDDDGANLLIDAHDRTVQQSVWAHYERVIARAGPVPALIEWDNDVPAWPVLEAEAIKADAIMLARRTNHALCA